MPAVSFQNVSKTFATARGELHALKDVSFDIEPGEFFGLLGPNGAGKTTFAREFLPNEAGCPQFMNADLIAAGARGCLVEIGGDVRVAGTAPDGVAWRGEGV